MEYTGIIIISGWALFIVILLLLLLWQRRSLITPLQHQLEQLNSKLEERARLSDELIRKINQESNEKFVDRLNDTNLQLQKTLAEFKETIQTALHQHRTQFDERQLSTLKLLQDSLQKGMSEFRQELGVRVETLTNNTDQRLKEISGQVEKRLSEGFEKTTATFTDVIKRLALIDEAQKKITELSSNVVSLQEVLADKRSRGTFGEVQLSALIRNVLPENTFAFQYSLSNHKRADCILFLPQPTGNVVIDAKFPLESYRQMTDISLPEDKRQQAEKQFGQDIRKHIQDIADKYIIADETADGAVMFIPAEAVFAEIHAHFPELVELSQKHHVWMVSPTTMMAILTTARAVLKDEATRKQVHIIREHLSMLSKDFERFRERMDDLAKHVNQAHDDIELVHTSARKITSRFNKIDKVEFKDDVTNKVELLESDD